MQDSEDECYNFSKDAKDAEFIILFQSSIGLVASAIVNILILNLSKGRRRLIIYGLVIYFMTAVLIHAFTHHVNDREELARVESGGHSGWLPVCMLFGLFDQTIHFALMFSILWINVYLVSFSWQLYKIQDESHHTTTQATLNNFRNTISCNAISGLFVVSLLLFILFTWIPLMWDTYGSRELICWIRLSRHDTCADRTLSNTLMLAMYNGPLLVISLLTVITLVIVAVLMCWGSTKVRGAAQRRFKRGMKEIMFLLIYPIILGFYNAIVFGMHIYSSVHHDVNPTFTYTVVNAVSVNVRLLMPLLGFLLYPYAWKNLVLQCKKDEDDEETNSYIPPEDDDIPHGTIYYQRQWNAK